MTFPYVAGAGAVMSAAGLAMVSPGTAGAATTGTTKFYCADSTDDLKTFSPLRELPGLSGTVHHGTVIADN
ncbi:hypothetical protein [Streptomyces sp. TRM68367]|uniref:hypothetical protein n=1 Tax=Streptomyces sp. TRM68367 TaxID=2758415 RepID=UPI00165C525F|nr:hypothetical protein [Streptomyces sp. TRM68367]MBC9728793.1 hypothetical protein [Streptomyces sp. TRM68367]